MASFLNILASNNKFVSWRLMKAILTQVEPLFIRNAIDWSMKFGFKMCNAIGYSLSLQSKNDWTFDALEIAAAKYNQSVSTGEMCSSLRDLCVTCLPYGPSSLGIIEKYRITSLNHLNSEQYDSPVYTNAANRLLSLKITLLLIVTSNSSSSWVSFLSLFNIGVFIGQAKFETIDTSKPYPLFTSSDYISFFKRNIVVS